MVGILIVGHAEFAKGLASAVELISGKQDNFIHLAYNINTKADELGQAIKEAVDSLQNKVGVVIFTDLKGGTPYNEAINTAIKYDNVEVISGTNMSMLIEAAMMRSHINNMDNFVKNLVDMGSHQVEYFDKDTLKF